MHNDENIRIFMINGLGCVSCAAKIEKEIGQLEGVKQSRLDFASGKLQLEKEDTASWAELEHKSRRIALRIESGISLSEVSSGDSVPVNAVFHLIILLAGILFLIPLFTKLPAAFETFFYLTAWAIAGSSVFVSAFKNLLHGEIFDENFLMGIASLGAVLIGEYPEAATVMLFYQVGEYLQDRAVHRSRTSIASLMDIRPDYAWLADSEGEKKVSPYDVQVGDVINIHPWEKVPLDGLVIKGESFADMSPLTGESIPLEILPGTQVLSGAVNQGGLISIKVEKEFTESTVSKILKLVENASAQKAPIEKFITRFAHYYTPTVVGMAAMLAFIPPLFTAESDLNIWMGRALVFLVASCPCALMISVPLGFLGGIGCASRHGILVKGGNYLEALPDVEIVVFDKTGTLTEGNLMITRIIAVSGMTDEYILESAALAESYSSHPMAKAILAKYGKEPDKSSVRRYEEFPGRGVMVQNGEHIILSGNGLLMQQECISYIEEDVSEKAVSRIYVAIDGKYAGSMEAEDTIRADSLRSVKLLKEAGVSRVVMLTGDSKHAAAKVAAALGITEVHAELLPQDKVRVVEELLQEKSKKGKLLFVGDGINDAPVLARADIGVAMGGIGSDAAVEAADIVIMEDDPSRLPEALAIASRTRKIIWQNIIFAFSIKLIVLTLGAGGAANMWEAVFADVGVAVLAVFNSMRVLSYRYHH